MKGVYDRQSHVFPLLPVALNLGYLKETERFWRCSAGFVGFYDPITLSTFLNIPNIKKHLNLYGHYATQIL